MAINPELEQNLIKAISECNLKDKLTELGCKEERVTVNIQLGESSDSIKTSLFCCQRDDEGNCTCYCSS